MRRNNSWTTGLAVLVTAAWLGCSPATDKEKPKPSGGEPVVETVEVVEGVQPARSGETAAIEPPPAPEPPPKPTIPEVKMTETLAVTCLVKVGDALPDVTLPNVDGKAIELRSLLGEKLTVICFWKADDPLALEELAELEKDVAAPYAAKGVRVVAINEGDPPATAAEKLQSTGATFAGLLDPNGDFFKQVATEKMPRTYLLDAQGKVLWFDIEYSQSTKRHLLQAIQVALGEI